MPQNKFAVARYGLIDEALRSQEFVKTASIVDLCRANLGYEVTQRTIQMDMYSMKHDTFLGIFAPIEYCQRNKAYYYSDPQFRFNSQVFSEKEMAVLDSVCSMVQDQLRPDDYHVLKRTIDRIRKKTVAN